MKATIIMNDEQRTTVIIDRVKKVFHYTADNGDTYLTIKYYNNRTYNGNKQVNLEKYKTKDIHLITVE